MTEFLIAYGAIFLIGLGLRDYRGKCCCYGNRNRRR